MGQLSQVMTHDLTWITWLDDHFLPLLLYSRLVNYGLKVLSTHHALKFQAPPARKPAPAAVVGDKDLPAPIQVLICSKARLLLLSRFIACSSLLSNSYIILVYFFDKWTRDYSIKVTYAGRLPGLLYTLLNSENFVELLNGNHYL